MARVSETALVLFSGGQDSTVCLAWALERFGRVETIGFDYGQRHRIELAVRPRIRERLAALRADWGARLADDRVLTLDALAAISETALTRELQIEIAEGGLPTTFVPGRNLIFLTFAGAVAYRRGAKHLIAGMCETDYSGYPDCRDDTIKAMQVALSLGMDRRFVLHTPLMWIDKAQTFALAEQIGGKPLLDLVVEETHSCYLGDRTHRHPWGYGCGTCPACRLRAEGFERIQEHEMTNERRRWIEGIAFLIAFGLTIPLANWMIGNVGTTCVPNGPCLIPVAPKLMAPSGVLLIGVALVLRDLVQRRLGVAYSAGAVIVGAMLSVAVAPATLALASGTAFLLSEFADLAVYTPLARRRLVAAVVASGAVGLVVDSIVFLWLAFGSLDFLLGQVVGKGWMVLLSIPFVLCLRRRDERLGLTPA